MSSFRSLAEIGHVYVERGALSLPAVERARESLAGASWHVVEGKEEIPPEDLNSRTLFLTRPKGRIVGRCPGSRGHVCCNYLTVDLYVGCPLGCSYCVMRGYLNFSPLVVHVDPRPAVEELVRLAETHPDRPIRVGTGEVGDSLFLDPVFRLSEEFIQALAPYPHVSFELKTKTASVDHLLGVTPKGRAVVGFSLNPPRVVAEEEGAAAPLEERLEAAGKALDAGFRLSFHFDPVFRFPGWEDAYARVVKALASFPAERIAWVSLGTIRYLPALKERMAGRPYLYDEFVLSRDGKFRYLQSMRVEVYRRMRDLVTGIWPGVPVYLCMESAAVWYRVFGALPQKIPGLWAIFERVALSGERGKR
ncbi:SPL family radical SAM protein [Spirochaeta thermophila]|uniref:Putative photolyase-like protein n=1 Tax=Winmispira thermophila (strain ATCC 49972 / DSM 6192 / RI 19.B1) TaxID=665571 RepID=E0RNH0_WINT6|nr:radical SAM protein [Spirochaeta thermophila]ADN01170.1 putative photolyase-like protein [Spirochaeta thermophila DSM 6192]